MAEPSKTGTAVSFVSIRLSGSPAFYTDLNPVTGVPGGRSFVCS